MGNALRPGDRGGAKESRITPQQAYLHAILDVILRHTDAGKAIYGPGGERLRAGDRLMNDLASTMEILAEGVLRPSTKACSPNASRAASGPAAAADRGRPPRLPRDLASADHRRVPRAPIRLEPAAVHRRVLIAYALLLLDRAGLGGPHGSADEIARLVGVMGEQALARGPGARQLHGGGLARRLYDEDRVSEAAARLMEERPPIVPEPVEPSRTTQISVVDAEGPPR